MRNPLVFVLTAVMLAIPAFSQDQSVNPEQQTSAPPAQTQPAAQAAPATQAQQPATPAEQKAAASPAPPTEQWLTGSIDLGYRWVTDVAGSFPEYRSTVNLGSGPRVFGIDFTIIDPKKRLFDRLDARGNNWGDPYNTAHVDVRKLGIYDFSFDYRSVVYFNSVPSFANPFAPGGINQQSFDVLRRNTSFDLTLRPGKHIVPYLGYWRNTNHGNTIDTFVEDATNAYVIPSFLRDSTDNYRGGLRFEFNRFHVTLEQGGTTFKDDDQSSFNGANPGDFTTPLFGQTLTLNSLQQNYGIRGDSVYSSALFTAQPTSWLNLYGQFLFSEPKVTVHYSDSASGNFLLMSSLLFYTGEQTIGTGAANQPHTTGNAGFELRPWKHLRIIESWFTDRYHDAASPAVAQVLLAAGSSVPLSTALNYAQVVNYNQAETDVLLDVTPKLTVRGGYRRVWGDATVLAGDLSQTGPLASGQLQRNIGLAGLSYRWFEKLSFNLDYEGSSSDNIYFRTSLNEYSKGRARARYQIKPSLALQATFQILNNNNPAPDIRYSFQNRDTSVSVFWTPKNGSRISFLGEYDRWTSRSDINYLGLFFAPAVSAYRDNAHTATSALDLALAGRVKLTAGGSLFISSGSRPTTYYQPLARLSVQLAKHVYWNSEWMYYGFGEAFYLYEGFRTHIIQTGLRVTR